MKRTMNKLAAFIKELKALPSNGEWRPQPLGPKDFPRDMKLRRYFSYQDLVEEKIKQFEKV